MIAPKKDELEVTIMGNGYGECIVIHYGNNDWIVIDSFQSVKSKKSVASEYLDRIGVDIPKNLKYIVVSHTDTDHIKGISTLYSDAKNAIFVMSDALNFKPFVLMAIGSAPDKRGTRTEAEEFTKIYSEIELRRKRPKDEVCWSASASQRIFCDSYKTGEKSVCREMWSLSPSNTAKSNARTTIVSIFDQLTGKQSGQQCSIGKIPMLKNNHTSVVLWLTIGGRNLLFGADLEELNDPTDGWKNIINLTGKPSGKSEFFKIPHHGSSNAHNDDVWKYMIENDNTSGLTAYSRNKSPLPQPNQLRKISHLSSNSYLVGSAKIARAHYDSNTDKLLRKVGKPVARISGSYGRITFRSLINDPIGNWSVDSEGKVSNIKDIMT